MAKPSHVLGLLLASAAAGLLTATPASGSATTAQVEPVTFNDDIAPILFEHCGQCHREGGWAPFSLLTFSEVRDRAAEIAAATKSRRMPPWKAESGDGPFVGLRGPTQGEIDLIERWVADGLREGDPRDLSALRPPAREWHLGTPDLIVTPPAVYTVPGDGPDVFRVFVIQIPTDATRYVRGLEFRPGNPDVVHHANILLDRTPRSRELDEADPEPGYTGATPRSAGFPHGHFLGWAPGLPDPLLPDALSWVLEPGTDLVVELHLRPSGTEEEIQPSVGFFFAETPPVEFPSLIKLGRQDIDIAPGDESYTITDSYVLPVDTTILALKPHAHYRAKEIAAFATTPDGTNRQLLRIANWDFKWQHTYRFLDPIQLPEAATLNMVYTYDNSGGNPQNPQLPPQRVRWGPHSFDEMGDLWIQVQTNDERDRVRLEQDFGRQAAAANLVGYEALIAGDPTDPVLHDDAAMLLLELGRPNDAVTHFESSVRLRPAAASYFNLGTALMMAGRLEAAVVQYREALRLDPNRAPVHLNLGNALESLGEQAEALRHYREALRLQPGYARAHNNIGDVLLGLGRLEEAEEHFGEALRIDAQLPDAHFNLALALLQRGAFAEGVRHLRDAVLLRPDWSLALTQLAWALVTVPEDAVRDGDEATRWAEQAASLTGRRDPAVLDVLAAAYAAAGRFDRARQTIQEAIELSPPEPALSEMIRRSELYAGDEPFRP